MNRTIPSLLSLALILALSPTTLAGTISISGALTDDPSTGIDPLKTYTHAISGGGAATINGVNFAQLSPGVIPANFNWSASASQNQIEPINNGDWVPATGGVTGAGLQQLLGGFTYSGTGADPGNTQQFTLSGLTPGSNYDLRFYVRIWDTDGSGRPLDLTFTNGTEVDVAPNVPEDRANLVLGGGASIHSAYYVNYNYTAQGTSVTIDAAVPAAAPLNSGSAHMYGLSNELVAVPEPGTLALAGLGLLAAVGYVARRHRRTKG